MEEEPPRKSEWRSFKALLRTTWWGSDCRPPWLVGRWNCGGCRDWAVWNARAEEGGAADCGLLAASVASSRPALSGEGSSDDWNTSANSARSSEVELLDEAPPTAPRASKPASSVTARENSEVSVQGNDRRGNAMNVKSL